MISARKANRIQAKWDTDSTETSNAIRRLPMITSGADYADFKIIKKSASDVFIVICEICG